MFYDMFMGIIHKSDLKYVTLLFLNMFLFFSVKQSAG